MRIENTDVFLSEELGESEPGPGPWSHQLLSQTECVSGFLNVTDIVKRAVR